MHSKHNQPVQRQSCVSSPGSTTFTLRETLHHCVFSFGDRPSQGKINSSSCVARRTRPACTRQVRVVDFQIDCPLAHLHAFNDAITSIALLKRPTSTRFPFSCKLPCLHRSSPWVQMTDNLCHIFSERHRPIDFELDVKSVICCFFFSSKKKSTTKKSLNWMRIMTIIQKKHEHS